jgi:hypothetical protein
LDEDLLTFMESRFGHDFSQVRIHADSQAALSAKTIGARAYTIGNNVVLGPGEFNPTSIEGKRLLAHELTHVIQQGQSALTPDSSPYPVRDVGYSGMGVIQRQAAPAAETEEQCNARVDEEVAKCSDTVNTACSILGASIAGIGVVVGGGIGALGLNPVTVAIGGVIGGVAGGVYGAYRYGKCVEEQNALCREGGRTSKEKCAAQAAAPVGPDGEVFQP